MSNRLAALLLLPLFASLSGGCATVLSGDDQTVTFRSHPSGARVYLDGREIGQTPLTTELSRWEDGRVTYELAGYKPHSLSIDRELNPETLLNTPLLLLGVLPGVVAFAVDTATGAIFEFDPETYRATLSIDPEASVLGSISPTEKKTLPEPQPELPPPTNLPVKGQRRVLGDRSH